MFLNCARYSWSYGRRYFLYGTAPQWLPLMFTATRIDNVIAYAQ